MERKQLMDNEAQNENSIHTRIQKIWLDKFGIIQVEYSLGSVNTLPDALESVDVSKKLGRGIRRPVLIDI